MSQLSPAFDPVYVGLVRVWSKLVLNRLRRDLGTASGQTEEKSAQSYNSDHLDLPVGDTSGYRQSRAESFKGPARQVSVRSELPG
jgi:hypothetical protein